MDSGAERMRLPFPERTDRHARQLGRLEAAKEGDWFLALRHVQVPFHPSDQLVVFYGHPFVSRLGLHAATDRVLAGEPVIYLDGAQTFDPFAIGRLARSRRLQPRKVLGMIHVARAFTGRQMERLLSDCLAGALDRYQSHTAVVSGLFDTLYDDVVTDREMLRIMDCLTEAIRELARQGYSLLCLCPSVPKPAGTGHRLLTRLRGLADHTVRVYKNEGTIRFDEEEQPVSHPWEVIRTVLDRR